MNKKKRLDERIYTVTVVLFLASLAATIAFWLSPNLRRTEVFPVLTGVMMLVAGAALATCIIRKIREPKDWLFVAFALFSGFSMLFG